MEQPLEWPTPDNIFSTAQRSPREVHIAMTTCHVCVRAKRAFYHIDRCPYPLPSLLMEISFQEFKKHTLPISVHLFFKKDGLKLWWSTFFFLVWKLVCPSKIVSETWDPRGQNEGQQQWWSRGGWLDISLQEPSLHRTLKNQLSGCFVNPKPKTAGASQTLCSPEPLWELLRWRESYQSPPHKP